MNRRRAWAGPPFALAALGAVLFLVALVHHASEIRDLDGLLGPLAALALDGAPALALVWVGYWLSGTGLDPEDRRAVVGWAVGAGRCSRRRWG